MDDSADQENNSTYFPESTLYLFAFFLYDSVEAGGYSGLKCRGERTMTVIAILLIVVFALYIFRNYWWLLLKAKWVGIETDASICRIEKDKRYSDGAEYPRRFFYVSFLRQDGLQTEARLLNPKGALLIGDKVRIRYLEEKTDCAILIR